MGIFFGKGSDKLKILIKKQKTMDYKTMLTLFVAGILGVLAHGFKESSRRNKAQEPKYNILNYWKDEINAIMMCVICLVVLSYYSCDVKQIKELPSWGIGLLYF